MEIIIKDDDVNYFTEPETLQKIYNGVWKKGFIVSFGIIPFQKAEESQQVPEKFKKGDKVFPVHENKNLIEFLKNKVKEKEVDIMLHGYHHKSENGIPEFARESKNLFEKVKKGKKYLEEIFNCEVKFFVPPHNKISKEGVNALLKNGMGLLNIPDFFSQPFSSLPDYLKYRIFWNRYKLPYPYPLKFGKSFQIGCISVYKSAQREKIKEIIEFYEKFPDSTVCFSFHWWELKKFPHLQEILKIIFERK